RPPGARRGLRRRGRLRARARPRQGEPGAARRKRAVHRAARSVRGGALPLARRDAPAGRARADGVRRGRRGDGGAAPRAPYRRGPVPPRVGADAGRAGARAQLPRGDAVIQQALARLLDGHDLTRDEARGTMAVIMAGEATDAQIAGFLVALRAKGETGDEIAGYADAMREHVLRVSPTRTDLVDVVGTGGDGANTYNISSSSRRRARTSCTAPAASTSSLPAGRTSSARSRPEPFASTSSTRSSSASNGASRRSYAGATRPRTPRHCGTCSPARTVGIARPWSSTRPAESQPRDMRRACRRESWSRATRSTQGRPRRGSTSSWSSPRPRRPNEPRLRQPRPASDTGHWW